MIDRPILHYYLAFNHIRHISSQTINMLKQKFGSLAHIFQQSTQTLLHSGVSERIAQSIGKFDWKNIDSAMKWMQSCNHSIITIESSSYPQQLKIIDQAPPLLFVIGNVEILHQVQIAIVGSRKPTLMGRDNSHFFAEKLVQHGYTITSGLATGIDAAAHTGAIRAKGSTIGVLGSGIDTIYPPMHRALATQIATSGALISEFSLGTPPLAANFPQRNRIISGLSRGIVVIEAAVKSGSLLTANHGAQQGREVFAIPGAINNRLKQGCHHLIKQGAKLVETIDDIIDELPPLGKRVETREKLPSSLPIAIDHETRATLNVIEETPCSFDSIMAKCGLSHKKTHAALLTLEMHGLIAAVIGGYCRTGK